MCDPTRPLSRYATDFKIHPRNICLIFRTLKWRHNECDGVSNQKTHDCLLNRLSRHRWEETSKLCVTGFCAGNSPVTGEFPTRRASNAENFPFDDVIMNNRNSVQPPPYKKNVGIYHRTLSPHTPLCWLCLGVERLLPTSSRDIRAKYQ